MFKGLGNQRRSQHWKRDWVWGVAPVNFELLHSSDSRKPQAAPFLQNLEQIFNFVKITAFAFYVVYNFSDNHPGNNLALASELKSYKTTCICYITVECTNREKQNPWKASLTKSNIIQTQHNRFKLSK